VFELFILFLTLKPISLEVLIFSTVFSNTLPGNLTLKVLLNSWTSVAMLKFEIAFSSFELGAEMVALTSMWVAAIVGSSFNQGAFHHNTT